LHRSCSWHFVKEKFVYRLDQLIEPSAPAAFRGRVIETDIV